MYRIFVRALSLTHTHAQTLGYKTVEEQADAFLLHKINIKAGMINSENGHAIMPHAHSPTHEHNNHLAFDTSVPQSMSVWEYEEYPDALGEVDSVPCSHPFDKIDDMFSSGDQYAAQLKATKARTYELKRRFQTARSACGSSSSLLQHQSSLLQKQPYLTTAADAAARGERERSSARAAAGASWQEARHVGEGEAEERREGGYDVFDDFESETEIFGASPHSKRRRNKDNNCSHTNSNSTSTSNSGGGRTEGFWKRVPGKTFLDGLQNAVLQSQSPTRAPREWQSCVSKHVGLEKGAVSFRGTHSLSKASTTHHAKSQEAKRKSLQANSHQKLPHSAFKSGVGAAAALKCMADAGGHRCSIYLLY